MKQRNDEIQQQQPEAEAATTTKKQKVVCENCDKSTQVDLPPPPPVNDTEDSASTSINSSTSLCRTQYQDVDRCMRENKGQISKCVSQWDAFRTCHDDENKDRRV
jgi:hypothetical protein